MPDNSPSTGILVDQNGHSLPPPPLPPAQRGQTGIIQSGQFAGTPTWLGQSLNESNPLPWQVYLPKETTQIGLDKLQEGASPDYYEKTLGYGMDKNSGLASAPGVMGNSGRLSPMSDALRSQAERSLGTKLQGIQNQKNAQVPLMQSQAMGTASDIFGQQYKIQLQNFKEQYSYQQQRLQAYTQWQNAKDAASAQFLGMVIGGALTVGAAVAA